MGRISRWGLDRVPPGKVITYMYFQHNCTASHFRDLVRRFPIGTARRPIQLQSATRRPTVDCRNSVCRNTGINSLEHMTEYTLSYTVHEGKKLNFSLLLHGLIDADLVYRQSAINLAVGATLPLHFGLTINQSINQFIS